MKKIIIAMICLFFITVNKSKAQVADTIAYIQEILNNKSQYIGKSFSVLEKSLKLEIKCFIPDAEITWDITKETSTSFWFINPKLMGDFSYPRLVIEWQPYLDHKKAISLFQKYNGGEWNAEVDSFYSPGIIKDISVLGDMTNRNGNAY